MRKKILIVDDDIAITHYLQIFFLQSDLYLPTILNDSTEVISLLQQEHFDLMLIDIDMPVFSGLEVLKMLKNNDIVIPTIALTGVMEVELAVIAMKEGAFDLLTKPIEGDTLLEVIDKALSQSMIEQTLLETTKDKLPVYSVHAPGLFTIVSQDEQMLKQIRLAHEFTTNDVNIFLSGERGVGKKTIAKAIHDASSRKNHEFLHLNLAKIHYSEQQQRVIKLFEEAKQGSVLLIHIDQTDRSFQQWLHQTMQTKQYTVGLEKKAVTSRLMVSTDMPSQHIQSSRLFAQQLYETLSKNQINVISLRHRPSDIHLYANHFLQFYSRLHQVPIKQLHPTTLDRLLKYSFPYNLEELNHIIYYMNYCFSEKILLPHHLPSYLQG